MGSEIIRESMPKAKKDNESSKEYVIKRILQKIIVHKIIAEQTGSDIQRAKQQKCIEVLEWVISLLHGEEE